MLLVSFTFFYCLCVVHALVILQGDLYFSLRYVTVYSCEPMDL